MSDLSSSVSSAWRPFVGRASERSALAELLERSRRGRAHLACFIGEPGIGKTRLAELLSERAEEAGGQCRWGRCSRGLESKAFWPWRQIFRGTAGDLLFEEARAVASTEDRVDTFDAACEALRAMANDRPLVIVLDDLHWSDVPSAALLRHAARSVRDANLFLVATWRDVDLRPRPELAALLHHAARDGHRFILGGWSEAEVSEYLEHFPNLGPDISHELHRRTAGNPFFITELVSTLTARPTEVSPALPETIRGAIDERLAMLPAEALEVLEAAAVGGAELDASALASVVSASKVALGEHPRSAGELARAIESTAQLGLAGLADHRRIRFRHDVVREALYVSVPPARRAELHLAIAKELSRRPDAEENASLIAHHHLAAGSEEALALGLEWGRRAAHSAVARGAYEAAAEILEQLLDAAMTSSNAGLAAELAAELAEARMLEGDADQGRAACDRGAALARAAGSSRALGSVALARGIHGAHAHVDRAHVALLEEALGVLDARDQDIRVQVMARLGAALQPSTDPQRALSMAREAIRSARAQGDARCLARTLAYARGAFRPLDDLAERLSIDQQSLELAEVSRDRPGQLLAHQRLVLEYLEAGDREKAEAHVAAHAQLSSTLKTRRGLAQRAFFQAMSASLAGDMREALAQIEAGAELQRSSGAAGPVDAAAFQRLVLARWWGNRDALESAMTAFPLPDRMRVIHANAWVALGRDDEARRMVEECVARGPSTSYTALVAMAEPCATLCDAGRAQSVYRWLLPFADRHVVWWGSGGATDGAMTRLLGRLAARAGDPDSARRHFEHALTENARLSAPAILARTQEDYAQVLLHEDASAADRERGAELMEAAERVYDSLSMELDYERIRRARPRAASVRGAARNASVGSPDAPSMQRSGEIWTITWGAERALVSDSDGLRYLAYLFERPGVDVHVLELVGQSRARTSSAVGDAEPSADGVGPALDARAKAEYRRRVSELQRDLEEAESWADSGRAEVLRGELERLTQELSRAVGLGGRDRPQRAAAERARVNVTQRIRRAIEKVRDQSPSLARELDSLIRTGTFCTYTPRP